MPRPFLMSAMPPPYVPSRGCLGCPYRGTCHDTRQRLQDPVIEGGRHYSCEFYVSIKNTVRERQVHGWYRFLALVGR